jgi:hypothetical protein
MLKSKTRLKWWFGASALVAAALLIVAGFWISRNNTVNESEINSRTAVAVEPPEENPAKTESQSVAAESDPEPNTAKILAKQEAPKKVKAAREDETNTAPAKRRVTIAPPEDEVSDDYGPPPDDWRLRREMRREERRRERRARRDAWRRAEDPDGLFHVNDIFEGRRRP